MGIGKSKEGEMIGSQDWVAAKDGPSHGHGAPLLLHPSFWSQADVAAEIKKIPLEQIKPLIGARLNTMTRALGELLREISKLEDLARSADSRSATENLSAADELSDYAARLIEMTRLLNELHSAESPAQITP